MQLRDLLGRFALTSSARRRRGDAEKLQADHLALQRRRQAHYREVTKTDSTGHGPSSGGGPH